MRSGICSLRPSSNVCVVNGTINPHRSQVGILIGRLGAADDRDYILLDIPTPSLEARINNAGPACAITLGSVIRLTAAQCCRLERQQ